MNAPYDLAFGFSVRLAATGLRTAPGVDPETEAAALATILLSDRTLDADGLELLARLVTGNLRKVHHPAGESILAHAVRRAGVAWRHGKDADPAQTGAALAQVLRDDPDCLGPGERALLADLVTGEMRKGQHAPPKGAGHPEVVAVVRDFRRNIFEGNARKNALSDTALKFNLTTRTVESYIAATEARERAADT